MAKAASGLRVETGTKPVTKIDIVPMMPVGGLDYHSLDFRPDFSMLEEEAQLKTVNTECYAIQLEAKNKRHAEELEVDEYLSRSSPK